jgi:hypothetical protein
MKTPALDDEMRDSEFARLLEQAYPGPDCPPPEAYLADAALSAAERARIETHADVCPACGAERALARAFDSEPVPAPEAQAIIATLRERAPWRAANVAPHPRFAARRGARRFTLAVPLALAAALVLGVGVVLQMGAPGAPPIGAPGTGAIMRGSGIDVVAPAGEVGALPDSLEWEPVPDAASYRVVLMGVDGETLWQDTIDRPPAVIPPATLASLNPTVRYRWQVEALDENGARIARSETTTFRAGAGPEGR